MMVSGLIVVGFFYTFTPNIYSDSFTMFCGGMIGFLVGLLCKNKFKWKNKPKEANGE